MQPHAKRIHRADLGVDRDCTNASFALCDDESLQSALRRKRRFNANDAS
jgi:hypothetical protein